MNIDKENAITLVEEAKRIMNIALSFAHPRFSDTFPEWSSVYNFAESVVDELERKEPSTITKEEFLTKFVDEGCEQETTLESTDWGCTMNVVIEHDGAYYKAEVYQSWGDHTIENFSINGEPELVVPHRVYMTEYLPPVPEHRRLI